MANASPLEEKFRLDARAQRMNHSMVSMVNRHAQSDARPSIFERKISFAKRVSARWCRYFQRS
jgi:hypothetical protein